MSGKRNLLIIVLVFSLFSMLVAQSINQVDIIFDASGSMWGQIDGVSKIEIARTAMADLMKDFEEQKDLQLALRVYGHSNKQCDNSILEIPMGTGNHAAIIDKINSIKPLGKTPIAYSLEQCVADFKDGKGEKSIVLITDGLESCDGDICAIAQALKDAGIITKIHIVGFGLQEDAMKSLACIVEPFGGKIIGAGNAGELKEAFRKIVKATVSYNLEIRALDDNGSDVDAGFEIIDENNSSIAMGDNSMNHVCKLSLEPGTYKIIAKNSQTSAKIEIPGIIIKENEIVKKEVVFAERIVEVSILDGNNNFVNGSIDIFNKDGENVKSSDNSMGNPISIKIIPGIYKMKVRSSDTGIEKIIENVDLINNKEFMQHYVFSVSEIEIKVVNSAGEKLYGDVSVIDKNGNEIKHADTSFNPVNFTVPSDVYSIKVFDSNSRKEVVLENIDLTKNKKFTKEVVID